LTFGPYRHWFFFWVTSSPSHHLVTVPTPPQRPQLHPSFLTRHSPLVACRTLSTSITQSSLLGVAPPHNNLKSYPNLNFGTPPTLIFHLIPHMSPPPTPSLSHPKSDSSTKEESGQCETTQLILRAFCVSFLISTLPYAKNWSLQWQSRYSYYFLLLPSCCVYSVLVLIGHILSLN
jgi:hypothetical protein